MWQNSRQKSTQEEMEKLVILVVMGRCLRAECTDMTAHVHQTQATISATDTLVAAHPSLCSMWSERAIRAGNQGKRSRWPN